MSLIWQIICTKGTVKNVLNGMQAAFVDIGGSQNAYLNLQQGEGTEKFCHAYLWGNKFSFK